MSHLDHRDGHNSDDPSSEQMWDDRYSSRTALWSGEPNPVLVAEMLGIAPGSLPGPALDVGCGEGGDSIWLARAGWQVHAVDVSGVAIERARAHAEEAGVDDRVRFERVDLLEWEWPEATYGLVNAHFIHLPPAERDHVYAAMARSLAPGGRLLAVAHHPSDLETGARRPPRPELFFTGADLEATFGDSVDVLTDEARPRPAESEAGDPITVHDTVVVAIRRP